MAPRKSSTPEIDDTELEEVETEEAPEEEASTKAPKGAVAHWFINPDHNYAPALVRKPVEAAPSGTGIVQKGEYQAAAREVLPGPVGRPRQLGQKISVSVPATLVDVQHDKWEGLEACQKALEQACSKASGGKKVIFVSTGFVAGKE